MVILGDMLELGRYSLEEHERIFSVASKMGFEEIILVGKEFQKISGTATVFENVELPLIYLKMKLQ